MNSTKYPPCMLYQMILCVQIHCEKHKVYWLLLQKGHEESLNNLYYILDNLIKECTAAGLGQKTSTSIVSIEAEDKMWNDGILGEPQPCQLSDTILYLLGVNLALHGGDKHKCLCRLGFQE